ncbi:hypothetical protein [Phytohabitans aurantiacus]|nr:hypothetical protein [Phytohabitans aurantiacus]
MAALVSELSAVFAEHRQHDALAVAARAIALCGLIMVNLDWAR